MLQISEVLHLLLAFLPAWFEVALMVVFAFMMAVLIFKLIAFVMDVIPFI